MRYLAIDYGPKRVGTAICDPQEMIVSPLCALAEDPQNPLRLIGQIVHLLQEQQAGGVVIGLPLNMDGSEGAQSGITRQFVSRLKKAVSLPLFWQDERLSSAAADEIMQQARLSTKKRKEKRDMLAAGEILEDFLERKKQTPPLEPIV